ncbi:hypothetical protein [Ideonella livida]|uniref:Uncharacterized protein n=1 Tax=Ideonella livida TaxID=2707176 RepID=A0A7C9PKD5_9BURK|nr:hypothetical protein [Ideonella livida]NDY93929.1 hypothetical protein [Ideonella livida]
MPRRRHPLLLLLGCLLLLMATACGGGGGGGGGGGDTPPDGGSTPGTGDGGGSGGGGGTDTGGGDPPATDTWREAPLTASALPPLQINLAGGVHSWMFANVLRASEAWVLSAVPLNAAQADATAAALALRPDGWPAGLPAGLQMWLSTAGYPTGQDTQGTTYLHGVWVLTWEGTGTLELQTSENNGQGETLLLNDPAARRIVKLITTPRKWPVVFVRSSSAADPVRNVKLWAPASDRAGLSLTAASPLGAGQVVGSLEPAPGAAEPLFHPAFLNHLKEAGSGIPLRMMSFLRINQNASAWGSRPLTWADRGDAAYAFGSLSVTDASWGRHEVPAYRQQLGMPYEWLIELCNATGNDLWIQVPHNASDDLIRNLARLIAGQNGHPGLNAGLRVWFEYSNEIWNGISPYLVQHDHAAAVAAAHFGVAASALSTAQFGWGSGRVQGQALATFQDEWKRLGGSDARLVNVVAGFAEGAAYNAAVLASVKEVGADLPEVLAISNYFGYGASAEILRLQADWTGQAAPWPAALVRQAQAAVRRNLHSTYASWQASARVAADAGVPLVAYEGGQHLLAVGLGDGANPAFQPFMAFLTDLQRSPVMRSLYTEHFALWNAAGGRTASLFTDLGPVSYWGYWGAKEWLSDNRSGSAKWGAFLDWGDTMAGVRAPGDPLGLAPSLSAQTLNAEAGVPYSVTLQAQGGDGATRLQWVGGELPEGLRFAAGTGGQATLSGTATGSATARLVLRAVDADGDAAYLVQTLQVAPAGASTQALLNFDGSQIPATVQADGRRNGRYDPRRAAQTLGSAGERLCVPFSVADGDALFGPEYADGSTQGGQHIASTSPLNLYGGWCVTQEQHNGSACESSYTSLRGGEFASWSGANCGGTGYPSTLDLFLVWRRDQFDGASASGPFRFGASDNQAALRVDFSNVIDDGDNEFRFAVLDGGQWWLSEAAHRPQVVGDGYFELIGFNGSGVAGKRWAPITPTALNFAIPAAASLSFGAHSFSNVQAVAVLYHGRRWGYHYNVSLKQFMALGVRPTP